MSGFFKRIAPTYEELRPGFKASKFLDWLPRKELVDIQYCKLVNYLSVDLSKDWMPVLFDLSARERFRNEVARVDPDGKGRWLRKVRESEAWGPGNIYLDPEKHHGDLGMPYEPYFRAGRSILSLQRAATILGVDKIDLLDLKLMYVLDERVLAHLINGLLRPRSKWADKGNLPDRHS